MPVGKLFKAIFSAPAQPEPAMEMCEEQKKRRHMRSDAYKPCTVLYPSGFKRRGVVMDMSERGVRIRFTERSGLPNKVKVQVDGVPGYRNATVAWHDTIDAGMRFQA